MKPLKAITVSLVVILAAMLSSCLDPGDPGRFFSGRPSDYAMVFNRTLDGKDESLKRYLQVPAHIRLSGQYADMYQVDLNNILKRTEHGQFASVYPTLSPEEQNALSAYLAKLTPEVRARHSAALERK